jgi:glycosyltransferase involved in cell wall biosynthesis
MKRILIISPCPGPGAGAEVVLEELLRAWRFDALQLVLLSPAGSRIHAVAQELGFEWHDLPVQKNGLYLRDNLRAAKAAQKTIPRCEAVAAWTIRVFPSADWLGRHWQVPAAGVLHDNPFSRKIHGALLWDLRGMEFRRLSAWKQMFWNSREYVLRTWWRWQWAQRAANRFTKLVCVSEAVRQDCVLKGYRCPLTVIRNGVADIPLPEKEPSDKIRIGFLGMEYPQRKGFSIVEQWIPKLGDQVVWKLYGNAPESTLKRLSKLNGNLSQPLPLEEVRGIQRENGREINGTFYSHLSIPRLLPQVSKTNGCKNDVEYCGFRGRETIFREIDVLVHTSTLFDPLPTVLIEAARAGIPCIASSNGGAGEIVADGVSGFIFDPKYPDEGLEKLKKLLDPEWCQEMGSNARKIFEERFRVERMVGAYKGVLG